MDHKRLWKILQEMGVPDHFICVLRNVYAGQEATIRTGHGAIEVPDVNRIQKQRVVQFIMLKILQARLQQYVNRELPDVQAGFRKGRTRGQIANIC